MILGDAHVVGNDVGEQPHPARLQSGDQAPERRLAAQLLAQPIVVGDVVAVGAARGRLEERRGVGIAHAERVEVVHDAGGVVERQAGPELQAIRGARHPHHAVPPSPSRNPSAAPSGCSCARASRRRLQTSKNRFWVAQRP